MDEAVLDMETVTVPFEEATVRAIEEKAFADHRDNRDAAVRELLDAWLKACAD